MLAADLIKKIFINTSSQVVAKAATVVLGFLTVGLLTRYLGVNQYGIYTLVFAYLSLFGVLADFGLQLSLVRDLSGEDASANNLKSTYFAIKIFLSLAATILSLITLVFFPYSGTIKTAIVVGSLAVGVGYMNGYGASVLQSKLKLDMAALLEVINRIATVIAIVIFFLLHLDLYAFICAVLIGNIVSLAVNIWTAPDYFHFRSIPPFHLIVDVVKASFPIGITTLLGALYFKIDTMMLSVMKTTADVGIYSLSYKIFENIIMLWLFYMATVYPLLSQYMKSKDRKRFKMVVNSSLIIAILFSIVAIIVGFFAAPLAIRILGGNNFIESILPFRLLLFAIPFVIVNNLFYYVLLTISKIKYILVTLLISLTFNFFVNLAIIPKYGFIGTSVSTIFTELIVMLGYLIVVRKYWASL